MCGGAAGAAAASGVLASLRRIACHSVLVLFTVVAVPAHAEPDESRLGKELGYPVGTIANWTANPYRVGSWSAMDQVQGLPVRTVSRGAAAVSPLPRADHSPAIRYSFEGVGYSLDDYLERQRVTGVLILKHGAVVAERYRYGRTAEARFLSASMAKSVTSLLIGVAVERGVIASLDDPAERYARVLAGSAYGATSIRHLLRMSSGLTFTERYDGMDDVARLTRAAMLGQPADFVEVLRSITDRHSPAGERFAYASAETEVLGRVLSGASGRTVSELTSEWLWQHLGAEGDAFWLLSTDGHERVLGYFNATLRDWGRLGLLLAHDGRIGDRQVVPREYLLDATDPVRQGPAFQPGRATAYFGYGYQFWLFPMRERSFALSGVYGQGVFVQPASGIVMVQTAAYETPRDLPSFRERDAFWRGVLSSLGGDPER
jgi:CubicO group peptidase (beta-lactamase class C family)